MKINTKPKICWLDTTTQWTILKTLRLQKKLWNVGKKSCVIEANRHREHIVDTHVPPSPSSTISCCRPKSRDALQLKKWYTHTKPHKWRQPLHLLYAPVNKVQWVTKFSIYGHQYTPPYCRRRYVWYVKQNRRSKYSSEQA